MAQSHNKKHTNRTVVMLFSAALLFAAKYGPSWSTLSTEATITLSVAIVMALFWVLEPIPIYATAFIPLVVFPLLGVNGFQDVAYQYANKNIYLFMGGFFLAIAMETTGLHRRIALHILNAVGTRPANILAGFIVTVGVLSMWISNTATVVMMIPIALSVIELLSSADKKKKHIMTTAIMLSIAFSASIGGMGTLVGTPPNAILAAFASNVGISIGFGQFMLFGFPIAFGGLILLWLLFTKIIFRLDNNPIEGTREVLHREIGQLPKMSYQEIVVLIVFVLTALSWILRTILSKYIVSKIGLTLSDPGIAMISALLLFMLPNGKGGRIITWKNTSRLPWGILVLFGGGLALGKEIQNTGVGSWIASGLQEPLSHVPLIVIITLIVLVTVLISQFASNTATAAAFLPIFYPLAESVNINPLFIMLPLTMAASSVFMLPSATPPNAIAMSSEQISVKDMVKYGGIVNAVFVVFVIAMVYILLKLNVGFDMGDGTFESFLKLLNK